MRQHNVKQLKQLEQRHKYSVEELRRNSERDLDTLRVSNERELEKFRQKLREDKLAHERYNIIQYTYVNPPSPQHCVFAAVLKVLINYIKFLEAWTQDFLLNHEIDILYIH